MQNNLTTLRTGISAIRKELAEALRLIRVRRVLRDNTAALMEKETEK